MPNREIPKEMPRLTTDASFCSETKAAAWAAWAESVRGKFLGGNAIDGVGGNNSVEMYAMAHGLRMGIERGIFVRGDHIHIQTDSDYVAKRLHPQHLSNRARLRLRKGIPQPVHHGNDSPRFLFFQLVYQHGLTFSVWRSRGGVRMREVDRLARQWMLEKRDKLKYY